VKGENRGSEGAGPLSKIGPEGEIRGTSTTSEKLLVQKEVFTKTAGTQS